jgi:NAD(P)-dependent dehydrogenase (short-subunit alcohol dehydrogenase family)
MSSIQFEGKVAIITGAGRGLGREYAKHLSARGATVVVNDLGGELDGNGASTGPADEVVTELLRDGAKAMADYGSVSDQAAMEALVARVLGEFGRIDIVINNAGTRHIGSLIETTNADFQRMLDVSLFGALNLTRAAWPALVKSRGRVINTVSASLFGLPNYAAYITAKGAVLGLTRALAADAAEAGIAVNAVAPVEVTRFMRNGGAAESILDWAEKALDPSIVAPIVAFLAHESCPLNGVVLSGGGGQVGAWLLGETAGVVNRNFTPELIQDNLDHIIDPDDWQAYGSVAEQSARIPPLVTAALEAKAQRH